MNYTQKLKKDRNLGQIDIFGNTHREPMYTDVWLTPQNIFDRLDEEFDFQLDPCTEPNNPLGCKEFFTEEQDGLKQKWNGNTFVNPPYSNIGSWVEKCYNESISNKSNYIVMLIPARTDTIWFHKFIVPYAEVIFIAGRLKFSQKLGVAPFPSMVIVFGNKPNIKSMER